MGHRHNPDPLTIVSPISSVPLASPSIEPVYLRSSHERTSMAAFTRQVAESERLWGWTQRQPYFLSEDSYKSPSCPFERLLSFSR
jgi:hypothetical protein